MSTKETLQSKREEILRIAEKYGASNVRVFGSVVRGEETENSDIDFLVELESGRSLFDHAGLIVDLEDLLEKKIDVATEKGLKPRYRENILREAIAL
jgi:predicted nucleotidyltransferase